MERRERKKKEIQEEQARKQIRKGG